MNDKVTGHVHWSFWAITIVALVWNAMGAMNYIWQMQMDAETLGALPQTHQAIIDGRPAWATGGFAIGVFGGALGCLLLLFRKSLAVYVFIASLLGMFLTMTHTIGVAASTIAFSPMEIFVMIVLPVLVAVFLIWYSKHAKRLGWIT